MRSGEVSKAVTINEPALVEYARVIANNLALLGPFSFQAIVPDQGKPQIIEINARFGGSGYSIAPSVGSAFHTLYHRAGSRAQTYALRRMHGGIGHAPVRRSRLCRALVDRSSFSTSTIPFFWNRNMR